MRSVGSAVRMLAPLALIGWNVVGRAGRARLTFVVLVRRR